MKHKNVVKRLNRAVVIGSAFGATVVSSSASAAIDLTGATTAFGDLNSALTTIGGLVISAALVAVTFKWIKGMIFS